jgi:hypothetical protein
LFEYGAGNAGQYFGVETADEGDGLTFSDAAATYTFDLPYSVADNQWHQVVVTWNNSTDRLKLYLDGQQLGGVVTSFGALNTQVGAPLLWIGSLDAAAGSEFAGSLQDFAAYSSVLSSSDVQAHWQLSQAYANYKPPTFTPYQQAVLADSPQCSTTWTRRVVVRSRIARVITTERMHSRV